MYVAKFHLNCQKIIGLGELEGRTGGPVWNRHGNHIVLTLIVRSISGAKF